MIYQHATSEADRAIADALNAAVKDHRKKAKTGKAEEKTKKQGKKTTRNRKPWLGLTS